MLCGIALSLTLFVRVRSSQEHLLRVGVHADVQVCALSCGTIKSEFISLSVFALCSLYLLTEVVFLPMLLCAPLLQKIKGNLFEMGTRFPARP